MNATEILNAAGLTNLPPGADPTVIAEQILKDHLVGQRVFDLFIEQHAAEVVSKFHPLEKEALRRRLGFAGFAEPAPKPHVSWSVGPHPINGKVMITMQCGSETCYWSGSVDDLPRLKFRGETVPADIATVYKMSVSNGDDPELEAARRDYAAKETAKLKQARYDESTKHAKQW
ncbi:MAG TPA: hypothetical protein VGT24_06325 [Candidatus Acidoferrales bacterium]|nr:hypothetical protein [Candidatus Acidoferrales bacterium]